MRVGTKTGILIEYDVAVPMQDGTLLAADIFRPAAAGRHPVILVRTPYDKTASAMGFGAFGIDTLAAVREGYVLVFQDVRGTSASEGMFGRYVHEADDGADSVAWAASQEWSTGAVGMTGASYLGANQLHAAMRRPPALKAITPAVTPASHYEGAEYQGGAFQLGRTLAGSASMALASLRREEGPGSRDLEVLETIVADPWGAFERLPLMAFARETRGLADYGGWLSHPDRSGFGHETGVNEHYASMDVPAIHIGGWYDVHLKGTLSSYSGLRERAATEHARDNQRLIVTPWGHGIPGEVVGDVWFGPAVHQVNIHTQHLEFFDAFLRGAPRPERAPVQIFVMGTNRWRDEDVWPLARAVPTRWHLRAGGRLTREVPRTDEPAAEFAYDPSDPVPTLGGNTLLPPRRGVAILGPTDRRVIRNRADIVVYTSDVLRSDVEVTGPLSARLHVATSARDTDFTVALIDIHPDGAAIGIADGILRLRYREGFDRQRTAEPGGVYAVDVDLIATSHVFLAGHRIGVEVSSSNFPRFDRNPNHGGVIAEATRSDFVVAHQFVFHDANRPSYVMLPVVPQ